MGLDVDLDSELRPSVTRRRASGPALAEMEVIADGDPADAEPRDQVMVTKVLRRGRRLVEVITNGVEPGPEADAAFGLVG
jgi:hypothetical protein